MAMLVAVNAVLTPSKLAAETISGADALNDPWKTTVTIQGMADVHARFQSRDYGKALELLQHITRHNMDLPPAQVIMSVMYSQAGMVRASAHSAWPW